MTGRWDDPAIPGGPATPQEWRRALLTRLAIHGLDAVRNPEPPIAEAWSKALRERGLMSR